MYKQSKVIKMKVINRYVILVFMLLTPLTSNAWVNHNDVTITRIMQFEGGLNRDYAILYFSNNGGACRVLYSEKELYSFVLSIHMAGKSVNAICHDEQDDPGGSMIPTHKLHRVITN